MTRSAPFYQAFVEIIPDASKLRSHLTKEFTAPSIDAGTSAGKGITSGILGAVSKLAAPIAAAFAGLRLGEVLKDSITRASDLAEAGTAIHAVFGNAAENIRSWAKSGARLFGESEISVLRAAQTFGVYGKAAGLAGAELTGFTTELVSLGTDLASFFNTDTETAIHAIGAGLRGESEPLRQFGVLLDDASLRARALQLGIYDGTGALSQQQRVLAAHAEILAQTTDAQGDFTRTSGGLANQQRILAASWIDLTTSLGAMFLPAATTMVGFLNSHVIPGVQTFISSLREGTGAFGPVGDFFHRVLAPMFQNMARLVSELGSVFVQLWQVLSPVSLILHTLSPVLTSLGETIVSLAGILTGSLVEAFAGVATAVMPLVGTVTGIIASLGETLGSVIASLVHTLGGVLGSVAAVSGDVLSSIAGALGSIVTAISPLVQAFGALLPPILSLVTPMGGLLGGVLTPLLQAFTALVSPILSLIEPLVGLLAPAIGVVASVLGFLIGLVADTLTWFMNLVTGASDTSKGMTGAFEGVATFFAGLWDTVTSSFHTGITGLISFFTSLPESIVRALGDMGRVLFGAGRDLIGGLLDGAASLLRTIGDFFLDIVPGFIKEPFKQALGIHSPSRVFAEYGHHIGSGLIGGITAMREPIATSIASLVTVPAVPASQAFGLSSTPVAHDVSRTEASNVTVNVHTTETDPTLLARAVFREAWRSAATI